MNTESQFSVEYGLGSSSAVIVCALKALAEIFKIKIRKRDIFNLAYQTLSKIQGVGSGFDIASAIYGGIIYFLTRKEPFNH